MSAHHSHHHHDHADHADEAQSPRYRKILWIALILNFTMFAVEVFSSWWAGSSALFADSIDFFGDGFNYALSLWALGMSPIWSSRAALVKACSMLGFGVFVLWRALANHQAGIVPQAFTMGAVSLLAMSVNLFVAYLLYQYREGNANMRSVWLCTRNDVLSNIAVLFAAVGVFGTASHWPDLFVAVLMATLAISSGILVLRQARKELKAQK